MSLIDEFLEPCVYMTKEKQPDGEGGWTNRWKEGMKFEAAIVVDDSTLAAIAEKQGVSAKYSIITDRNIVLEYPDVIKRLSDGQTFRVTDEQTKTPASASLNKARISAEKWSLS